MFISGSEKSLLQVCINAAREVRLLFPAAPEKMLYLLDASIVVLSLSFVQPLGTGQRRQNGHSSG